MKDLVHPRLGKLRLASRILVYYARGSWVCDVNKELNGKKLVFYIQPYFCMFKNFQFDVVLVKIFW